MKKIRSLSSNPTILLLLLCCFLYTSCSRHETLHYDDSENSLFNSNSNMAAKIQSYTAEEIFTAIYFLEGDFVNEMKYLQQAKNEMDQYNLQPKEIDEKNKFIKTIITEIKDQNPTYFDDFKNNLSTNNLFDLKQVYTNGLLTIENAAKKVKEYELAFLISKEFIAKDVDFDQATLKNLDLSTDAGVKEFKKILLDDYQLDFDKLMTEKKMVVCNFGIACAVALVVVATMALVAQSVAGLWVYWVYAKVKFWGKSSAIKQSEDEAFILELSQKF